jgi:hypothetical protein
MRHLIAHTIAGFGAFVLVAGLLLTYYVAPALIAAPADVYEVTRMRAENATYFDAESLKTRTGATVAVTTTTRGDVRADRGDIVVWDSATTVQDVARDQMIELRNHRVAFDRRSAGLTTCCGASVQGDTTAPQSGIGLFWPVHVVRKNYELYDTQTQRTWPIAYQGEERVHGVSTYRFVQRIPPTKVPGRLPDMPGDLLGLSKISGAVAVDRYYEAEATYWIDPRTGAPVDQRQTARSTLRSQKGPGRLVVADMNLRMTPESQKALLDKSNNGAAQIHLLKTAAPRGCFVAGLVILAAGVLLNRKGRHRSLHRQEREETALRS